MTNILGDSKFLNFMAYGLLLLIVLAMAFWLYRLFFGPRIRGLSAGRSRQPRLGVVDSYDLDAKRQLVLIRRDNIEHLIMIGGPNDVVIESALTRTHPAVQSTPAALAQAGGRDLLSGVQSGAPSNVAPPIIPAMAGTEESPVAVTPVLEIPAMAVSSRSSDLVQDPPAPVPPISPPTQPAIAPAKAPIPPVKSMPSAIPSAPIPPRLSPTASRPVTSAPASAKPLTPKPVLSPSIAKVSAAISKPESPKVEPSKPGGASPIAPASNAPTSGQKDVATDQAIDALEQEMARLLNRPPGESR